MQNCKRVIKINIIKYWVNKFIVNNVNEISKKKRFQLS
jgi:hypothetical protein